MSAKKPTKSAKPASATPDDAVRAFLGKRKAAKRLIEGGLPLLLEEWERVVEAVVEGYPADSLDDYLNDMDVRQILDELRDAAPRAFDAASLGRLEAADWKIGALLIPAPGCLWGAASAKKHGWDAERNWWYFMQPSRSGAGLSGELEKLGEK
jgi:hypothetical protein